MEKANALIAQTQGKGLRFQEFAKGQGLRVQKLTVSLKNGLDEEARKWHGLLIEKLKVGEVASFPVSYGNDLLVVHYKNKKSSSEFELEVAVVPKLEYGPWYEKEKAKIPAEVYDKSYLPQSQVF